MYSACIVVFYEKLNGELATTKKQDRDDASHFKKKMIGFVSKSKTFEKFAVNGFLEI